MTKLNNGTLELAIAELNGVCGGATGGIVITHGGGNVNVAKGTFSEAAAPTTLGGIAGRHGVAITNGGNSHNAS